MEDGFRQYDFSITGVTPLLMHADNIEFGDKMSEWRKDPKNKQISKPGDDRSPPWTWIGGLYSDGTHVAIPTDNLAVAVRQAGSKITLKGMKTFKEESVSGIFFNETHLPLNVNGKHVPVAPIEALEDDSSKEYADHLELVAKLGFKLFMKRAKVGTSKHIRVRPIFDKWSASGTITVNSPVLKPDILEQIFQYAGRVGIGSWRPGGPTPGRYGMFTAKVSESE